MRDHSATLKFTCTYLSSWFQECFTCISRGTGGMSNNISRRGGILGGSVRKSFGPLPAAFPFAVFPVVAPPIELEPPIPSRLESRLACLKRP
jgi:hypothetical protein